MHQEKSEEVMHNVTMLYADISQLQERLNLEYMHRIIRRKEETRQRNIISLARVPLEGGGGNIFCIIPGLTPKRRRT